jgi:RNA polymerase sigma-70 factor (sigma-E family)
VSEVEETFEAFVRARSVSLVRTAYLLTGDRGHAEDLVQEVLGRMHHKWRSIETPEAYARRALVHQATSRWRWRSRRPRELEWTPVDNELAGADDPAGSIADKDMMARALAQLPPRQRAVIALRYLDDLTLSETAAVLGCSVGAVKSQGFHALERLRELIQPDGESTSSLESSR